MFSDFRFALRGLVKTPGFAISAALTLALGVGANTTIFTVVNAELLRPLPYSHADRLVRIFERNAKLKIEKFSSSVLNTLDWQSRARCFESIGMIGFGTFAITGAGEPEQVGGTTISRSLMPLLGIQPVAGRGFREGEDAPGAPRVAMISRSLWQRRFGGESSLVGKDVLLNGTPYKVVGIAPESLEILASGTDIWTPLTIDRAHELRLAHLVETVARLKPGISIAAAQAEMNAVTREVGAAYPEVKDWSTSVVSFSDWLVNDELRTALLVLLGAVGLVLLAACANVANLLLSRAVGRQSEIAVRAALGASRGRIARQLLAESLVLAFAGGGVGVALAAVAVRALQAAVPAGLLPVGDLRGGAPALLFAFGIALVTGLLFGLAPVWQMSRADLNTSLKQGGRTGAGGGSATLRNALAAGELAMATMLLAGAGLLIESLAHLRQAPVGFQTERLLTFQIGLPPARYPNITRAWAFYRSFLDSLRATPGVRGAAISSALPFGQGTYTNTPYTPVGSSILQPGMALPADWRAVSPGFFDTMHIPLLRGRDFGEQDVPGAPVTILVSQSMARKLWGDSDPIGRVIMNGIKREFTVVGVVGDVRGTALGTPPEPTVYYSAATRQWPLMDVAVRTAGDPMSVVASVRTRLRELDAQLPMASIRTMEQWMDNNAAQPKLNGALLTAFAAIALLIAAVGAYGVLSYSVTLRTREIGLRMALGAQPGNVVRLVVGEGMMMAAVGIGAGVFGAWALSRLMRPMLFGVAPGDPATVAVAAVTLGAVALAACYVPARRAARVDPILALRQE
jgi:putative ABC transport system permease protein